MVKIQQWIKAILTGLLAVLSGIAVLASFYVISIVLAGMATLGVFTVITWATLEHLKTKDRRIATQQEKQSKRAAEMKHRMEELSKL